MKDDEIAVLYAYFGAWKLKYKAYFMFLRWKAPCHHQSDGLFYKGQRNTFWKNNECTASYASDSKSEITWESKQMIKGD